MSIYGPDQFLRERAVPHVSADALAGFPTGALMERLDKLHRCFETIEASEYDAEDAAQVDGPLCKDDPRWSEALAELKAELAKRPHVPRPVERKAARREQGSRGRTRGRRDR